MNARHFPLVVTDVRMPDGDGLQLMRSVRVSNPSTAVIVLTAFGNVPEAVQAMRGGACDYLTKPISFEELQSAVERVMRQRAVTSDDVVPSGAIVGTAASLLRASSEPGMRPEPMPTFSSKPRAAPAKSSSRATSTTTAIAANGPSSR